MRLLVFDMLTDKQLFDELYAGRLIYSHHYKLTNSALQKATLKANTQDSYSHSRYVDLFSITNMYLISYTLSTHSSSSIPGE